MTITIHKPTNRFVPPPIDAGVALDESYQARLTRIVEEEGLAKLANTTVMVLGLGGVGSNCAESLARGGIGSVVLVDHDTVQESNINRQAIAFNSTVGKPKVHVMAEMMQDINPNITIEGYQYFLTKDTIVEFVREHTEPNKAAACTNNTPSTAKANTIPANNHTPHSIEHVDYVIDAIDTVSAKLALATYADKLTRSYNQTCLDNSTRNSYGNGTHTASLHTLPPFKLISCMGAANKIHPECFSFADLYDTINCPLCRIMRKEGRKRGIQHLTVLYSSEQPVQGAPTEGAARQQRSNLGTMSYVPPIMGQMLAGKVICDVLGLDSLV